MDDAGASNIRVAIEFQYESLMHDKVHKSVFTLLLFVEAHYCPI